MTAIFDNRGLGTLDEITEAYKFWGERMEEKVPYQSQNWTLHKIRRAIAWDQYVVKGDWLRKVGW